MKNIKKFAAAALAVAAVGIGSLVHAENQNRMPSSQGGLKHENLNFIGTKPKVISASNSATQLVTGEGFLDGICAFGGTTGHYALPIDSGSTSGITTSSLSLAIGPKVYTTTAPATNAELNKDCWTPPGGPVKFIHGLVGIHDDTGHTALYYVHCNDGSNPCAP